MKFSLLIILGVVSAFAQANASTGSDSITQHLPNIIDRVSKCSFLPFTIDQDGHKSYHAILSHCPEVKVVSPGVAKIKVASHIYQAVLVESRDSDGDFYDVSIQDVRTGENKAFTNIAAYGDILLGVLGGNTEHVMEQEVNPDVGAIGDANLVHATY
jgi:hypothetical protein